MKLADVMDKVEVGMKMVVRRKAFIYVWKWMESCMDCLRKKIMKC